ncbi:MAG: GNAT family N-acetyltransferase [Candidatus Viridilinea halotolerans]|uniref:GNAT family N-acetyltransferase n=1 Tax=Candidatus Viridilinea halotolerans TaxID=2491704 RepID=A0A426TTE4_9CHLR|nr:MAG: GNAT family N-acetyltransferase [Candidatus Viridilinea halotolerans]
MQLTIRPMTRAAALAIMRWRYPEPYAVYNFVDGAMIAAFLAAQQRKCCFQIEDALGNLVAFCCFGSEAQIPGGDYHAPALDVGLGLHPDLTGQGQGMFYLQAIIAFTRTRFGPQLLRLTVAVWNKRAMRLYTKAGFVVSQRFCTMFSGEEFLVMTLEDQGEPGSP